MTNDQASQDQTTDVSQKLTYEQEHFEALMRMRGMDNYYQWVFELLKDGIGRRVLDAGCGVGNFSALLEKTADYILAAELSSKNIAILEERFKGSKVVEILQIDLNNDIDELTAREFDTVVCLDVLEHIQDDVGLLRNFYHITQPNGHLLLKVPACPWLFGSIDIASDHFRRYTLKELIEKTSMAGWQLKKGAYMNIFGVLPYWIKSRILRKQTNFSRTFSPWQLNLLRLLMPILKTADSLIGPPVGQSTILVAQKDEIK